MSETSMTIDKYNEAMDALMQQFRNRATRGDIHASIHQTLTDFRSLQDDIARTGEK